MSVTKKRGLAPAQTARPAASHTSGWKGGPENVTQSCQRLCGATGLGITPGGGHGRGPRRGHSLGSPERRVLTSIKARHMSHQRGPAAEDKAPEDRTEKV